MMTVTKGKPVQHVVEEYYSNYDENLLRILKWRISIGIKVIAMYLATMAVESPVPHMAP